MMNHRRIKFAIALALATSMGLSTSCLSRSASDLGRKVRPTSAPSEWTIASQLNPQLLRRLSMAYSSDSTGAIGHNQPRYQSVAFQRYTSQRVLYGLITRNIHPIEQSLSAIEYAFAHQNPDGSFLMNYSNARRPAPIAATASDAAGFYSDFGRSLLLLQKSEWFSNSQETSQLRSRVQKLIPSAQSSLTWLIQQADELKNYHQQTTNLLFLDAAAYSFAGQALKNESASRLGEHFTRLALTQQNPSGFFLEKGGYDTSYQGVSLELALLIYTNLTSNEAALQKDLWKGITQGVRWQLQRILPSGQISTAGNSRVSSGGERYFGREKGVDYSRTIVALLYYAQLSGDKDAQQAADRAISFKQLL